MTCAYITGVGSLRELMAKDRRKHIRNSFITTVVYSLVDSEESLQPVELQQGITLNSELVRRLPVCIQRGFRGADS